VPAGAPLPQLRIDSGASRELGDLAGSWAWAHTQLLVAEGSGQEAAGAMQSDPDRHVSRLLCPRRLTTDGAGSPAWCRRSMPGCGGDWAWRRSTTSHSAPAWSGEDQITLPLYFHWEFSTGPAGDFESLARRLQPFKVGDGSDGTPTVGTVEDAHRCGRRTRWTSRRHPERIVEMDGALRACNSATGASRRSPTALTTPLGELLDAIADPSGSDPDDGAVGPPLYGAWAINRFRVHTRPAGSGAQPRPADPRRRGSATRSCAASRRT
jgi:hypothetical protein